MLLIVPGQIMLLHVIVPGQIMLLIVPGQILLLIVISKKIANLFDI